MTDEEPRLIDTGRGLTVSYLGRLLYPADDPVGGARRRAAAARIAARTLVFVPSLALGYGLEELAAAVPPGCHVLCVEADQKLMALALRSAAPLPQRENLSIVRTHAPEQAAALLQELGAWRFRRLAVVSLSGGSLLHPQVYREMRAALEEELRLHWQNRLTLMHMSRLWLKNLFANLPLLSGSSFLEALESSRPVVVAGAGPSLEAALSWIRPLRSRLVLAAADTALPVLADAGLEPDWVLSLESQSVNLQDFLPAPPRRACLLGELTACPQTLRLFDRRFLFSCRFHPLQLFDRLASHGLLPTPLPPRGSVGVTAVEAALRATAGPVILAGLDFAYPGQQTHARGAPAHRAMLHSARRLRPAGMGSFEAILGRPRLWLRAKSGARVLSDLVLRQYALQLRRVVASSPRVFAIGAAGLDSGARSLPDRGALAGLCSAAAAARGAPAPAPAAPRAEAVLEFCRSEIGVLEGAEREIRRLLEREAQRGQAAGAGELAPSLRRAEYLFLHLPLSDPQRRLLSPNLRAAGEASRYYRSLLTRAAAEAESLTPRRS